MSFCALPPHLLPDSQPLYGQQCAPDESSMHVLCWPVQAAAKPSSHLSSTVTLHLKAKVAGILCRS